MGNAILTLFIVLVVVLVAGQLFQESRRKRKKIAALQVGKTYRLINHNPWAPIDATIIEIRDGWVRYKWSDVAKEQHDKVDTFIGIYG